MRIVSYAFAAAMAWCALSHCKSESGEEEEKAASIKKARPQSRERVEAAAGAKEWEGDYKSAPGLAMNRNPEIHALLTQPAPEWLALGRPVTAEVLAGGDEGIEWRNAGSTGTRFTPEQKDRMIGVMLPPEPPGDKEWASAIPDSEGGRILMVPLDMTTPAALYRIEGDSIVEDSREEVPVVNFDDRRRWFIQWQDWISDSEIVGIFNEEDFSGHITVRSGIYLYHVDNRELRRVDLPYGFISGNDPDIEIKRISRNALAIGTSDGEKIVVLGK